MFIRKKWTKKERAELLISIGGCLRDGYPLHLAIQLQAFQKQPFIRKHINMMLSDLKKGRRLHRILQTLQFPNDVCSYVYFAEESGELAKGLNESGQMLKKREEQKEALQKLMRYPLLLFWVFSLMIFVIGHYLLPNFLKLYRSLAIDLPLITKIFLFMSGHIYYLLFFLVLILLTAVIFFLCFRRFSIEKKFAILLFLPFVADYTRLYTTHQIAFHFGSLLRSGMSIYQAVDALSRQGITPFLRFEGQRLEKLLRKGERFEQIISGRSYYEDDFAYVIHHGQLNGMLGESLYQYSEVLLNKMTEKAEDFLAVCQPAMLVVIGGLVLCLFASIMLPIFHIVNGL